ncbi:tetratricopeptide repeat protein [Actinoplanes sp. NPDC026619]|uniref:ATP-binding protein n=1 Tax=Actinoplanes sp. NPDC026619 TaxID=3155798 RepID=UPI0033CA43DD
MGSSVFGDLVRAHRRRLGMTQEELAERAGVSVRSVGKWEASKVAAPRMSTMRLLADAFRLEGADRDRFLASAAEPATGAQITPAQLPSDPSGFTGRDRELTRLDALLDGPPEEAARGVVISAVSGTAGVGKTTLAIRWAHRVRDRFPDGQLYVNLRGFGPVGPPVPATEALRGLLDGLGVAPQRIPADLPERAALYRSVLAGQRMLILLDNAGDAEQVRPLLPGVPGCVVVVTSRDRLAGLAVADGAQLLLLDVLDTESARDLLARRMGADRVRAEPRAVDDLVRSCARLPLALAIVAARAAANPGFPLTALAAELREARSRLDVLAGPDPATDVRGVFSWSYRKLGPDAARLFRLFALHATPVAGAPALASLAGLSARQVRPALQELLDANLLAEQLPGRYGSHDLLRDYARDLAEEIDSDENRDAAARRMIDHYLQSALAADHCLKSERNLSGQRPTDVAEGATPESFAGGAASMAWFAAEQPALRACADLAIAAGLDAKAWWMAWAVLTYLERRWDKRNWAHWQMVAVAAAERAGDVLLQAVSHYNVGFALAGLGDLARSRSHLTTALALYRELSNVAGMADVHLNLGIVARREGRYSEALEEGGRALELSRSDGDRIGEARAMNNIGWCYLTMGDYRQALDYCRRAVTVHEAAGNRMGAGHSWDSVGMAHFRLGELTEAVACYRRAAAAFRDENDQQYQGIVLSHLGDAEEAAGRHRAARDAWRNALAILTELDHPDADDVRAKLADREVHSR